MVGAVELCGVLWSGPLGYGGTVEDMLVSVGDGDELNVHPLDPGPLVRSKSNTKAYLIKLKPRLTTQHNNLQTLTLAHNRRPSSLKQAAAAADLRRKFVSGQFDEENPFVLISSGLLVQPDEGVSDLVMDRIGVTTAIYREEPGSCNTGWSQAQVPAR
ncbi:hypothetical protein F511_14637 [Dorcoceras hygrometricum]|uniref:Uncharacterized protein n=1 Tax=Dorcoceras hygrometricum TaxID=472368 RepID=A0A2Z7D3M8_9LAMI|nr:hypothetical protein F511_14637 [Dorcoceras hygrometricum]